MRLLRLMPQTRVFGHGLKSSNIENAQNRRQARHDMKVARF